MKTARNSLLPSDLDDLRPTSSLARNGSQYTGRARVGMFLFQDRLDHVAQSDALRQGLIGAKPGRSTV